MSNLNLDCLKISLEYEGRKIITEIQPYKTLKNVKDLSKKLFFILEKEIELIYKNQIIEQKNLKKSLGEFFTNKNLIHIKIVPKSTIVKNSKLKLASLKNNNKLNDINISNLPKNYLCNECKKNVFSQFCRNCNLFLCNKCRISKKHENHKNLDVNIEKLEENIKYYSIMIQNEMKSNVLITKNYEKKFKRKNFIDFSSRHEIIQRKYNNLFDKYQEIINNLNVNENKNFDLMIKEYQNNSKNYYQQLEQITNELKKNKKNLNFSDFKRFFDEINRKEKKINKLSRNLVVYKINYEITEKLNKIYDDIEMILDMTLNSKIPFFIDQESFNMYQLILNENNYDDDENEENESKKINSSKMKFKEKYFIDAKNKNENEESKNNFYVDDEDIENDNLQKNFEQKMQNDYVNNNNNNINNNNNNINNNYNNNNNDENYSNDYNNNNNDYNNNNNYNNNDDYNNNNNDDYNNNESEDNNNNNNNIQNESYENKNESNNELNYNENEEKENDLINKQNIETNNNDDNNYDENNNNNNNNQNEDEDDFNLNKNSINSVGIKYSSNNNNQNDDLLDDDDLM